MTLGMPEDTAKKSRQYITLKAPPSHRTTSQSGSPREEDDEGDEETEDQQPVTDRSLFNLSFVYFYHATLVNFSVLLFQILAAFSGLDFTEDSTELQTDVAQRRAAAERPSDEARKSDGCTGSSRDHFEC